VTDSYDWDRLDALNAMKQGGGDEKTK